MIVDLSKSPSNNIIARKYYFVVLKKKKHWQNGFIHISYRTEFGLQNPNIT